MIETEDSVGATVGNGLHITCSKDDLVQSLRVVSRALTSRRIDGQFPNYKQLLPEAFEYELTVPRIEFLDVVKRASVMIQRSTPLQIRFAEGELTVIARTHEVGESKESMPIGFTGDTLEMGFNADFLRDGLESGEGDDFTYLVMPIRLPG